MSPPEFKVVLGMIVLGAFVSAVVATVKMDTPPIERINGGVYDFKLEDAGVTFKWSFPKTTKEEPYVQMELSAAHLGWIGVGFREANKIDPVGMQDADMVVVWVQKNGTARVCDYWTDNADIPLLEASQDYKLISGHESDGKTTVSFKRLMVTQDPNDVALSRTVHLIWAQHHADVDSECVKEFGTHDSVDHVGSYIKGIQLSAPLKKLDKSGGTHKKTLASMLLIPAVIGCMEVWY